MRALVVIPTYNERDNLRELVAQILAQNTQIHILIVDDASPDKTAELVEELMGVYAGRVFLEKRKGKLGLGTAYVHGFKWGMAKGYDYFIEMDADFSHNPKYLKQMLSLAASNDFVVASRYVKGGGTINWGFIRKLISKFGSFYSRSILGVNIHDFTGGFNGWHRRVLEAIGLDSILSDGYSFQVELKYRAAIRNFAFTEFPIVFEERRAGASKMSFRIILEAMWRVWQIRAQGRLLLSKPAPKQIS